MGNRHLSRRPPRDRRRSAFARLLCNGCCDPRPSPSPFHRQSFQDYLAFAASICMSKGHRRRHKGDSADRLLQHMLGQHPTWIYRQTWLRALPLHAWMI